MMRWVYWCGWAGFGSMFRTLFGMKISGREHLITEGPVLVVSNHQSFIDPPLIGNLYHQEIWYLARKTLFTGFGAWLYPRWKAIPVDQERPDMASLKTVIKLLKSGKIVLIFPEGERTRDGSLGQAQPGVGLVAAKSGAPIQPVRIRGAYEALPRGSSRVRLSRISVNIGPPIRLTEQEIKETSGKEGYERLANRLMAAIAEL